MKTKLSFRELLAVGSMLFGLFFGAGNLIFPASMGQLAGSRVLTASAGLLVTGVGLPLLGGGGAGHQPVRRPGRPHPPGGQELQPVLYLPALPDHRALFRHPPVRHRPL